MVTDGESEGAIGSPPVGSSSDVLPRDSLSKMVCSVSPMFTFLSFAPFFLSPLLAFMLLLLDEVFVLEVSDTIVFSLDLLLSLSGAFTCLLGLSLLILSFLSFLLVVKSLKVDNSTSSPA